MVSLRSLRAVAAIRTQRVAHDSAASLRHTPEPRVGNFFHQTTHMQAVQDSAKRGAVPLPTFAVLREAKHGDAMSWLVAKSLAQVVARQNGSKQTRIFFTRRVEAGGTASLLTLGFGQNFQIVVARRRIIHRRQGFRVTLVASQGVALIVVQIANPFAHGKPTLGRAAIAMLTFPEDFEFPRFGNRRAKGTHPPV